MDLARKKQECVFCNVQFVRRKCLAFFHCVTLVTSIIAIFCVIFFENFCQIKCFSRPFQLPMHRVQKFHLLKVSFHFISANSSIILIVIYIYIYMTLWFSVSLSLYIYCIIYIIYIPVCMSFLKVLLWYMLIWTGLNWFHFLISKEVYSLLWLTAWFSCDHSYILQGCLCHQFLSSHSWTLGLPTYRMLSLDIWFKWV